MTQTHARSVAFALVLGGCTPTLEFQQCRNDLDCRNAEGLELICSEDHTCAPPLRPEDQVCRTGMECREVFGAAHVCSAEGTCASLLSEACDQLWFASGADPDRMNYVAAILPEGELRQATRMAAESFDDMGWIGCRNDPTGASSQDIVHALVRAGVQTFVGGQTRDEVTSLTSATIASGSLLVTPVARLVSLSTLRDSGLVWRSVPSDTLEASAMTARLLAVDPVPLQVLVVAPNDVTGREVVLELSAQLEENELAFNQATLLYPAAETFGNAAARLASYREIAQQGLAHQPNAIIVLGGYESSELTLQLLLERDTMDPRPPLPRFYYGRDAVPFVPAMLSAVDPSFRTTLSDAIEGITPRWGEAERYAAYSAATALRFEVPSPMRSATAAYDATLMTALAIKATGVERPTGAIIAAQFPRLFDPTAPVFDFALDPNAQEDMLARLGTGDSAFAMGYSGPLEFDLPSGDRWSDFSAWKFRIDANMLPSGVEEIAVFEIEPPPSIQGRWTP